MHALPVHTTLLGANILIVEHLCNLESLPDGSFTFSAIPPKFQGRGRFRCVPWPSWRRMTG
ncbi:MAG: hypothetical protein R2867_14935 [Caldilineaceae bacterium]